MTGSAYPEYQRAPDAWMGDVPAHWGLERMKYGLTEKTTKKGSDLPPGAISYGKVVAKDAEKITPETRATYQEVLAGEYLINPINLNYDLISLRTALSDINVCVSPAYIVLRAVPEKVHPVFGSYVLHVFDVCHMKTLGAGVRQTITFKDIGQCVWPLPPLEEQAAIARFLDQETGRIDGLIEKKTRFITLLKEKRAAVITHAVTKGIDPDAPMKDSDNAWLRHIPAHWVSVPIKHHVQLQSGFAFKAEAFGDTGTPLVRMSNLKRGELDLSDAVRIPAGEENPEFLLRTGDILLGMSGSIGETGSLGNFSVVQEKDLPCLLNQRVGRFVFVSERVVPDYFKLILQSKSFLDPVFLTSTSTAQFNISPSQIGNVFMALPDVEEQIAVVDVVHAATLKIDSLIALTERSIDLLREKRAALITAAVTGKIDVRTAA